MKNLIPDFYLSSILDVTPEFLRQNNLKGVILDIDNTLIGHNVPLPDKKVSLLLDRYRSEGIKICVISNNRKSRVQSFCEKIGVDCYVWDALKPRKVGYVKAAKALGLDGKETAAIGDQIFTDIWGARRAGCCAILLKPIHKGGEGAFIAFKRILEKPLLFYIKRKGTSRREKI